MAGPRTRAERDALTVEIMFAVVTGGLLAAVLFFAVASPAFFGALSPGQKGPWMTAPATTAATGFALRVVQVLWRLPRKGRGCPCPGGGAPGSAGTAAPATGAAVRG